MSTIKTSNLQNGSSSSVNIALNTDGSATFAQMPVGPSYFAMRNKAINGAMEIAQRGTAAVTANGAYPVDRFQMNNNSDGAYSAQQVSDAPADFSNSIQVTITTADSSLSASQYLVAVHRVEGYNAVDFGFGSSSAKQITLSFWVKSSLTGTFGGAFRNADFSRSYPFTYSISVANTWEKKTVTISGDITGTWNKTTGLGLDIVWSLGAGSTFSGTAGTWAGSNLLSSTGAVSVIGTLNATWQMTGVQVEVGSVATPFERRLFTTELQLAQRYFVQWTGTSAANGFAGVSNGIAASATTGTMTLITPVTMRTTPSLSFSGTLNIYDGTTSLTLTSIGTIYIVSPSMFWFVVNGTGSSLTAGRGAFIYTQNAATNFFRADAEF